jgi:tetraprenyl-beta-curcumene synthase
MRAAGRYWLKVFPAVGRELRRRRELALAIPDPVLRRLALQALECKRSNLEGSAAFELLAGRHSSRRLVRALCACQTMCDYLDLLAEQPVADPVANGHRLHQALMAALAPDAVHARSDYYTHHSGRQDGGYLQTLIEDVQQTLCQLPSHALVRAPLRRMGERIVAYQSFNHGDHHGSHAPFRRWASGQTPRNSALSWWETAAGLGSTLLLLALISSAARPTLTSAEVAAVEGAYFPWIGALHTLLDSLVDLDEDRLSGGHQLVGRYRSAEHAAVRMRCIAHEGLRRAQALPGGRRHALLLIAMTGFYLCDTRPGASAHACAVRPALLQALGGLAKPAMLMLGARRAARRPAAEPALISCGR